MQTPKESTYAGVVASPKKAGSSQTAQPAPRAPVSSSQASSSKAHPELKKVQRTAASTGQAFYAKKDETGKIINSNTEVLLGFFHGELIHNYTQNLK